MSKFDIKGSLRLPRGTHRGVNLMTGKSGELVYNEERKLIHVHDGVTPGGNPVPTEAPKDGTPYMRQDGQWVGTTTPINISGPLAIRPDRDIEHSITNFDVDDTYIVSVDQGTASLQGNVITLNVGIYEGPVALTVERGDVIRTLELDARYMELEGIFTEGSYGPSARYSVGVGASQDTLYMFGGYDNTNTLNDFWAYHVPTDTWQELSKGPEGRIWLGGLSVIGDKVYLYGGHPTDIATSPRFSDMWEYDIPTDIWTQKTGLTPGRDCHTQTVVDGKIYVCGGNTDGSGVIADVAVYDPATDTWGTAASLPQNRQRHEATELNGYLYISGGHNGGYAGDLLRYDPATDTWVTMPGTFPPRTSHVMVGLNGRIYVFGGRDPSTTFDDLRMYDIIKETWTLLNGVTGEGRGVSAGVGIGDRVYLYGGWTESANYTPLRGPTIIS